MITRITIAAAVIPEACAVVTVLAAPVGRLLELGPCDGAVPAVASSVAVSLETIVAKLVKTDVADLVTVGHPACDRCTLVEDALYIEKVAEPAELRR